MNSKIIKGGGRQAEIQPTEVTDYNFSILDRNLTAYPEMEASLDYGKSIKFSLNSFFFQAHPVDISHGFL